MIRGQDRVRERRETLAGKVEKGKRCGISKYFKDGRDQRRKNGREKVGKGKQSGPCEVSVVPRKRYIVGLVAEGAKERCND